MVDIIKTFINNKKLINIAYIILVLIMISSYVLSEKFDDTSAEYILRIIPILSLFLCGILKGIYAIFIEKHKIVGCFYFITSILFLSYCYYKIIYFM